MDKIKKYFDEMSVNRNRNIESDPILKYEQDMRQKAVFDLLEANKDDFILEVGCGNARDLIPLGMMHIRCVGVDISSGMIEEGKKDLERLGLATVRLELGSGTSLGFSGNIFDKIICSEVLEHIPDYEAAIREMARVLKPGGKLVITTPNRQSLYGINRRMLDFILALLKIRSPHPCDEWKTQKELVRILRKHKLKTSKKVGICFIPGHWTYLLPKFLKKIVVGLTRPVEEKIRYRITGRGYMIGLSSIKE